MPVPLPSEIPQTHTAIIQHEGGELKITPNLPVPAMEPGDILVKTVAVALNPIDNKMRRHFPSPGTYAGCDFAGTVVAMTPDVQEAGMFEIGDRVFAAVHGNHAVDPECGAFGEYLKAVAIFTWRIPAWMSFEEAAGMSGTCIATSIVALFWSLKLPGTLEEPAKKSLDVLVYGGASCVGSTY
jgi:NADPH:quinone reductase-like Zn-dependent oxidoreductase